MDDDPSKLLDDIFADVDANENAEAVANSCDEESDLDEPKELPPTPAPAFPTSIQRRVASSDAIRGSSIRRPLSPATTTRTPGLLRPPNRVQRPAPVTNFRGDGGEAEYWMVQWRKPQQKKHKTWDGDAFLRIYGQNVSLHSEEGKLLASSKFVLGYAAPEVEFKLGGMECQIDRRSSKEEFDRTTTGVTSRSESAQGDQPGRPTVSVARTHRHAFKPPSTVQRPTSVPIKNSRLKLEPASSPAPTTSSAANSSTSHITVPKPVASASFYSKPAPKKASPKKKLHIGSSTPGKDIEAWGGALHDPTAPGAVVMERPPVSEAEKRGTTINDVVLDPHLAKVMREHQKDGVKFMYRCVMGMTGSNANGCILADDMGLGKTLQTIALIWTLCRQSPFLDESHVIGRALVVCPATLVANWKQEFLKWLPRTFRVLALDERSSAKVTSFTHNRNIQVLIISYERLRNEIKHLTACQPKIDLVVCDEGHRLKKSGGSKTSRMFDELSTRRRIILSGTPVQNDLGEYWAMANFVCPGILGTYSQFQKRYENPIVRARAASCTQAVAQKGRMLSEELRDLSLEFLLRRGADILSNYLPQKTEYVVFVAPTAIQLEVYRKLLNGVAMNTMISHFLPMIAALKKVANSPVLLRSKEDDEDSLDGTGLNIGDALSVMPRTSGVDISLSGKLMALDRILRLVYESRDEKIVVVSNWTSTLDLIEELCKQRRYKTKRLDGSTPQKQRQDLVNAFNRESRLASMVFLLSTKAGGVGLNLVGASRLVLFDSDWNPAHDLQAMARIHRDGQKKQVYIYRLLTVNTIDEKIYQRQLTKTGLSDQMMGQGAAIGGKDSRDSFTQAELRDIFTFTPLTGGCQTHDLLDCKCQGRSIIDMSHTSSVTEDNEVDEDVSDDDKEGSFVLASQYDGNSERRKEARAQRAKLAALKDWSHVNGLDYDCFKHLRDVLLHNDLLKLSNQLPPVPSSVVVRGGTDGHPPRKKARRVLDDSDGSCDEVAFEAAIDDTANASLDEDAIDTDSDLRKAPDVGADGAMSDASDTDNEPVSEASLTRRKRPAETSSGSTTYDLEQLAEDGHGGRILFVFEKIAKARFE